MAFVTCSETPKVENIVTFNPNYIKNSIKVYCNETTIYLTGRLGDDTRKMISRAVSFKF